MTDSPILAVVGSINVDTTLRVSRLPDAGETILSSGKRIAPGGKGANQAAAATLAAGEVHLICAYGTGPDGDVAARNLRQLGVDLTRADRRTDADTGTAVVIVADDAENAIVVDPGANAHLSADYVTRQLKHLAPRVILTQLETPVGVARACASHTGATWRILNPAPMSGGESVDALLEGFDIVIPNRTELGQLAGLPEPRTIEEVIACVGRMTFDGRVIVTMGAAGAAMFASTGVEPVIYPPPQVKPIDTSGAGDVFCGVFASELAAHGAVGAAVERAVAVSAASTESPGAQLQAVAVSQGAR